jgi:predicted RNA-binding Zn ribbon-like protein
MEMVGTESSNGQLDLELILKFINTWNIMEGTDELSSPRELVTWFSRHNLAEGHERATTTDLRIFLKIREGLRALAMLNNGETPETRPLMELREVVERQGFHFTLTEKGPLNPVPTGRGLNVLAGSILLEVYRAMVNGTWRRLKTCQNDTCLKAFYDHSRNHSGKWCSMSVCGNRTKVRRYLYNNPRLKA